MGGRTICSSIVIIAVLIAGRRSFAATEYDVIDMPGMSASNGQTYARALNNLGQVVGGYSHVLLYSGGTTQDLGFPIIGTGINNSGQIVGFTDTPPQYQLNQAFFYSNGTMTNLASILPYPGASWAHSVNASGETVIDNYDNPNGGPDHLLTYQNGVVTDLHVTGFSPTIINDLGHIAGVANNRAAFYDGLVHDLGTAVGETSIATGLNNLDQITGYRTEGLNQPTRAFLYSNGAMTDIGTLGGANSYAKAMNDLGQIVGTADKSSGGGSAFIYSDGQMTDLNTLIAPDGNPENLIIGDAFGISNSGYILATAWVPGQVTNQHTVLLTPVASAPEPRAATVFLPLASALLHMRRRRTSHA